MMDLMTFLNEMFEYYSRKPTKGMLKIYAAALKDVAVEDLYKMLEVHITDPDSGQFMPKVADLVRISSGTKKGGALEAWNKIYVAITTIGPYRSFVIDDPWAMKALDEIGGFLILCELTDKELEFKSNDFCKLYEMHRGMGIPQTYPSKVKGLVELENGDDDVLLLGNPDRAKKVLSTGKAERALKLTTIKKEELTNSLRLINEKAD